MFLAQPEGVLAILTISSLIRMPQKRDGASSGPARRCSRCRCLADPSPDRLRSRRDCAAQNRGHLPAPLHKSCVPQLCFRLLEKFSSKWEKNMNIVNWCVLGMAWLAEIFTLGSWPNPSHMVKSCLPKLSQKKKHT